LKAESHDSTPFKRGGKNNQLLATSDNLISKLIFEGSGNIPVKNQISSITIVLK